MNEKNNTGWIVAGVLAVIVVVLMGLMWNASRTPDLDTVLNEGYEDIATIRAKMQIKCEGPARNDAECEAALEELADILREFGEDLSAASTTPR